MQNRIDLINDLIENDKTQSWGDYAIEYGVNDDSGQPDGRKANDWWRYYQKTGKMTPDSSLIEEIQEVGTKVLIYDIETSRATFKRFWTGKQYIGTRDMVKEPQIVTIAYKWLGEDKVYNVKWENHLDDTLVEKFLKIYNSADMTIGVNQDKFDHRWLVARAAKHRLRINNFVKSFDIQKQAKRVFRIPGYSMAFMCEYFGVQTQKFKHSGISMWDKIEDEVGKYTKLEQEEAMAEMIHYNEIDVLATEDLFYRLRPYFKNTTHLGVLDDKPKYSCPDCGGTNIKLYKTLTTAVGTIQRIMICKDDGIQFKISNTEYLKFVKSQAAL